MKQFLFAALTGLFFGFSFSPVAAAHYVLPPELAERFSTDPNFTVQDLEKAIDDWARNGSPGPLVVLDDNFNPVAPESPEAMQALDLSENMPGKVALPGSDSADLAESAQPEPTMAELIRDFIRLGIEHILIGFDHILFVLALVLVAANLRQVIMQATVFTVAHTVTFLTAALGIVVVSPRVAEPLIAFSIGYVALTSVFLARHRFFGELNNRLGTIFFFGLFHGLGFAGLLSEFPIPEQHFLTTLISFNIGIEIGQIIVIAVSLPIIFWLRRFSWWPTATRGIAVLISLLAFVWVAERIFDFKLLPF